MEQSLFLLVGISTNAYLTILLVAPALHYPYVEYILMVELRKEGFLMATTVFRVEKSREFVVMSNKFLRERQMSLKAKGLLALCLALPDDWDYSINGLCAICKESQTSIRSALKELETFNYLERKRHKDAKGQFVYEYIIYETPYAENLHTDKQHTEKRHKENRRQQSNKGQTIKKQNINNDFMGKLKSMYEEEQ